MKTLVHQIAFSPYCVPITSALTAFGVSFRAIEVPVHRRDAIIKLTGGRYYQVPVLIHGKRVVFESGAETLDVARYVDHEFAAGRLFPAAKEGIQRILIPHIENEVEAVTFRLVDPLRIPEIKDVVERTESVRHKERRFGRGCLEEWRQEAPLWLRKAETLLTPFNLMLNDSKFLLGSEPVYADFALLGIVGALTYGGYVRLPKRCKSVARWRKDLEHWKG